MKTIKRFLLPLTIINTTKATDLKTRCDFSAMIAEDKLKKNRSIKPLAAVQVTK